MVMSLPVLCVIEPAVIPPPESTNMNNVFTRTTHTWLFTVIVSVATPVVLTTIAFAAVICAKLIVHVPADATTVDWPT